MVVLVPFPLLGCAIVGGAELSLSSFGVVLLSSLSQCGSWCFLPFFIWVALLSSARKVKGSAFLPFHLSTSLPLYLFTSLLFFKLFTPLRFLKPCFLKPFYPFLAFLALLAFYLSTF